jgi:hypothetical protein
MGGKVPERLHYSINKDKNDLSDLKHLSVSARNKSFVEVNANSKMRWWWQCTGGDLNFWVTHVDEAENESLVWPKFCLLTVYVPECRTVSTLRKSWIII